MNTLFFVSVVELHQVAILAGLLLVVFLVIRSLPRKNTLNEEDELRALTVWLFSAIRSVPKLEVLTQEKDSVDFILRPQNQYADIGCFLRETLQAWDCVFEQEVPDKNDDGSISRWTFEYEGCEFDLVLLTVDESTYHVSLEIA